VEIVLSSQVVGIFNALNNPRELRGAILDQTILNWQYEERKPSKSREVINTSNNKSARGISAGA